MTETNPYEAPKEQEPEEDETLRRSIQSLLELTVLAVSIAIVIGAAVASVLAAAVGGKVAIILGGVVGVGVGVYLAARMRDNWD